VRLLLLAACFLVSNAPRESTGVRLLLATNLAGVALLCAAVAVTPPRVERTPRVSPGQVASAESQPGSGCLPAPSVALLHPESQPGSGCCHAPPRRQTNRLRQDGGRRASSSQEISLVLRSSHPH